MNNEFEERGYKLIDLNLGYEELIIKSFEECIRTDKILPKSNVDISPDPINIYMEYLAAVIHREYLTSIIEKEIDLRLIPTFCYTRKYFKGSILTSHTDRDPCEITLTYCISGPEWEINIGDDTLITKIGNGVVYKGCEIPHGRSKPSSDDVIQVMNCWVISDGTRSSSAYDKQENNKNFYKKVNMKKGSLCSVMDNQLSHEICQKLINLGKGKWNQAQTYGLDNIRKSDIVWIQEKWVYDLITPYMFTANEDAGWKYNIVAAEACQVTRYTKDGFYSWHRDGMGSHNEVKDEPDNEFLHGTTRKLSMTIVLNSNFEGGDFEMKGLENKILKLEEGSIIVFPSFLEHRVAPVTKGIRYSLVAWFVGPPFV